MTDTTGSPETSERKFIVVGVDGSANGRHALEWAITEAAMRGVELDAVCAWPVPVVSDGFGGVYPLQDQVGRAEEEAHKLVSEELQAIDHRGVVTNAVTACGQPADVLMTLSEGADLVVVGSRGRGGFKSLLLGSTSQQLSHHLHCPLVIIPHTDDRHLPR